ncbi:MAG: ABC transporter ATP-binding protein [Oscillospiraceae bacterium]|jgi:osmoprotectant transport system ATP-binding protein|nr:ABC transporter ATP-binding protein [Oscillospiraceae bacterium]
MIRFEGITKRYDQQVVVSDISFEVEKGELVVIIGPSGCGKTTLLKIINRLIRPTSGRVYIGGADTAAQDEIELRRNMGYVIQQTGLFPHMTVRENIEIIPRLQRVNRADIEARSVELMRMVGLDPEQFLDRYPSQLSGGQQQRVGVARAFACDPEVILMDEPFSALDPLTRVQLQDELADLQARVRKTIVFVTHDMDEAVKIADRICLIHEGGIVQYDTVEAVMKHPANGFVADFIGRNRIWSSPAFIRARDIMIQNPVCASADTTVMRCIERMRTRKVDSLLITGENMRMLGIISAREVQTCADRSVPVSHVMRRQFEKVSPDENIVEVLQIVNRGGLSAVPVLDEAGAVAGLITKSSLLTTLSRPYLDETEAVTS